MNSITELIIAAEKENADNRIKFVKSLSCSVEEIEPQSNVAFLKLVSFLLKQTT